MADFCKQCSEENFGEDFGDLVHPELSEAGRVYTLCEGCGFNCVVDKTGKCVAKDCLKKHGEEQC